MKWLLFLVACGADETVRGDAIDAVVWTARFWHRVNAEFKAPDKIRCLSLGSKGSHTVIFAYQTVPYDLSLISRVISHGTLRDELAPFMLLYLREKAVPIRNQLHRIRKPGGSAPRLTELSGCGWW